MNEVIGLRDSTREDQKYETRIWPRHEMRVKVVVESKPDTFFTYIENLSLGGAALEDELPEHFHGQSCAVSIRMPDSREKIHLKARILSGYDGGRRLCFEGVTPKQTFQLHDLLAGHYLMRTGS